MISLPNWITSVAVMICSPEKSRLQRAHLAIQIFWVANERRIRRFVNYTDDAFPFHCRKIRTDQVVVRKVHYVRSGEGNRRNQKKQSRATEHRRFHQSQIAANISNRCDRFSSGACIFWKISAKPSKSTRCYRSIYVRHVIHVSEKSLLLFPYRYFLQFSRCYQVTNNVLQRKVRAC